MSENNIKWFYLGQICFGILVGLLVGVADSEIVNSVVGLLFAFIGGSIIALIKGRKINELVLIGKSISLMTVSMLLAVSLGIYIRVSDPFELNKTQHPILSQTSPLSYNDLKSYGAVKEYTRLLCYLVKNNQVTEVPGTLIRKELINLMNKKVDERIILAMLTDNASCETDSPLMENKKIPYLRNYNEVSSETTDVDGN